MKRKKLISLVLAAAVSVSAAFPCISFAVSKTDDGTVRESLTSAELVKNMGFGWNLGDTLDVCNADRDGDGRLDESSDIVDETLWGNPRATQELFNQLKSDGIRSVRIPVTWRDHMGPAPDYTVDEEWMNRVQEVVNYARNAGMYVIINIHHDGGGDPDFGAWICHASSNYDTFIQKYKALWSQIAERFKDYSDYLVFESMNEVGFDDLYNSNKIDAYNLLNKINQEFVNLIRASGGNNDKRHLLIAGYWTDIAKTCSSYYKMPNDPENRCILSVHYYTPWQFCTTNIQSTWGTAYEVNQMKSLIKKLDTTFVSKGTPVIIGEYAASGSDLNSCVLFIKTLNELCHGYGIATFLWDNGGQVDRNTYKWRTPVFLNAIKEGNGIGEPTPTEPSTSANPKTTASPVKTTKSTASTRSANAVKKDKLSAKKAMNQAKIRKLKVKSNSKKKINVTWKKVKKAKGYEIQVSNNKKFKKNKIILKKSLKKTKLTIKNKKIKSKKTYYIRVRAYAEYKNINNKTIKVYSKWNKHLRKIKVK